MTLSVRARAIREVIKNVLQSRADAELAKLKEDDIEGRRTVAEKYSWDQWLGDKLPKLRRLKHVSHPAKGIHKDAGIKTATSVHVLPSSITVKEYVSSAWLDDSSVRDFTGDAAALAPLAFLNEAFENVTLFDLALRRDPDFLAALHDDYRIAEEWLGYIVSMDDRTSEGVLSSTIMKQVYWMADEAEGTYHLLSPMLSSALGNRIYRSVQGTLYGEDVKAARDCRKAGKYSVNPVIYYNGLAKSVLGGTKPQNVSLQNNQRSGTNYHFSAAPPTWHVNDTRRIWRDKDIFGDERFKGVYGGREGVQEVLAELQSFLASNPDAVVETRARIARLVAALVDELFVFTLEVYEQPQGWSQEAELSKTFRTWLDPLGSAHDDIEVSFFESEDWVEGVGAAFARWLIRNLKDLPLGDNEFTEWKRAVTKHRGWSDVVEGVLADLDVEFVGGER